MPFLSYLFEPVSGKVLRFSNHERFSNKHLLSDETCIRLMQSNYALIVNEWQQLLKPLEQLYFSGYLARKRSAEEKLCGAQKHPTYPNTTREFEKSSYISISICIHILNRAKQTQQWAQAK